MRKSEKVRKWMVDRYTGMKRKAEIRADIREMHRGGGRTGRRITKKTILGVKLSKFSRLGFSPLTRYSVAYRNIRITWETR
jgi:hypothetical protein